MTKGRRQTQYKIDRQAPVSSSSFYFILKKLREKYNSSHQNLKKYFLKLQKNKEVGSNLRHPRVEDDEMFQSVTSQRAKYTVARPRFAQGSFLRQLNRFNFQLKGIIFWNQREGQEPPASRVGWSQREAQFTFLQKRIKKKKIQNLYSFQIINKTYRQKGQHVPKNIVWKINNLKNKYRNLELSTERTIKERKKKLARRAVDRSRDRRRTQTPLLKTQKIQFSFQNFSILYVRQNENVLQKQLIAELPFFEKEISLENEQEILSNESGEIYFENLHYLEKTISDIKNEIQFKKSFVRDIGGFWILFGRSFQHSLMMGEANALF